MTIPVVAVAVEIDSVRHSPGNAEPYTPAAIRVGNWNCTPPPDSGSCRSRDLAILQAVAVVGLMEFFYVDIGSALL